MDGYFKMSFLEFFLNFNEDQIFLFRPNRYSAILANGICLWIREYVVGCGWMNEMDMWICPM